MIGKLYAFVDTRGEARLSQRNLAKNGTMTLITKEYGGYAVRGIPKSEKKDLKILSKRKAKKKDISPFGFKIKLPNFRL